MFSRTLRLDFVRACKGCVGKCNSHQWEWKSFQQKENDWNDDIGVCFTPQFAKWWLPWLQSTLFDHPQSWLGLQLLVNSSVPTKLQKHLNIATPSSLFAKELLQGKTLFLYLTSPCHALMSIKWRFVALCVWKCSLMSTMQLVRLFLYNTMWVRFFLSKSFQFLTTKAIYNCKLSEMSFGCDNLFLGFCFFDIFKPKAVQLLPL